MKKIINFIISIFFIASLLSAQKTIEDVNYMLDTQPYFSITIDYKSNFLLSDSVKQKLLTALNGKLTQRLHDSLLSITSSQKASFLEQSKLLCKEDTICIEQTYQRIIAEAIESNISFYDNQSISNHLVLAVGNWNIKEAIPILENAIENERYEQHSVLMALAKLGNDSIKQTLMEKYTLSYILQNTEYDTLNDNVILYDLPIQENAWRTIDGIKTAIYLENKEMLLNILELIYIRGISGHCINDKCRNFPNVFYFVDEFNDYTFRDFPNYETLNKICEDYRSSIRPLSNKKLNKKEQQELEQLLSTEYRTKIKEQIQKWIIENVNFG